MSGLVERYDLIAYYPPGGVQRLMVTSNTGEYVKYSDYEKLRAEIERLTGPGWLPIDEEHRDGELWIVSNGVYSVPAWYCDMPGEDCWYEYNRGPADGKDQYGIAPTLCKPFPKAST